jgi:hypothetical protein
MLAKPGRILLEALLKCILAMGPQELLPGMASNWDPKVICSCLYVESRLKNDDYGDNNDNNNDDET